MIKTYWMCVLVQEGDNVIRTGVLSLYPIITIFFLFIFFVYFFLLSCVFFFFFFVIYEYTLDTYIQNIYISIVIGVTEGSNGPWMFNYGRIFMELVRHIEIIVD